MTCDQDVQIKKKGKKIETNRRNIFACFLIQKNCK